MNAACDIFLRCLEGGMAAASRLVDDRVCRSCESVIEDPRCASMMTDRHTSSNIAYTVCISLALYHLPFISKQQARRYRTRRAALKSVLPALEMPPS